MVQRFVAVGGRFAAAAAAAYRLFVLKAEVAAKRARLANCKSRECVSQNRNFYVVW